MLGIFVLSHAFAAFYPLETRHSIAFIRKEVISIRGELSLANRDVLLLRQKCYRSFSVHFSEGGLLYIEKGLLDLFVFWNWPK
jgi:hypothetical protein